MDKMKAIPHYLIFLIISVITVFILSTANADSDIYFASLVQSTENNRLKSSDLNFYPVKKALTENGFKEYRWKLHLTDSISEDQIVGKGLQALLLKKGKIFLKASTGKKDIRISDRSTLAYELYFRDDIKIYDIEKKTDSNTMTVFFKTEYAQIPDQDKWKNICIKDNLKSGLNYFISFFYSP